MFHSSAGAGWEGLVLDSLLLGSKMLKAEGKRINKSREKHIVAAIALRKPTGVPNASFLLGQSNTHCKLSPVHICYREVSLAKSLIFLLSTLFHILILPNMFHLLTPWLLTCQSQTALALTSQPLPIFFIASLHLHCHCLFLWSSPSLWGRVTTPAPPR